MFCEFALVLSLFRMLQVAVTGCHSRISFDWPIEIWLRSAPEPRSISGCAQGVVSLVIFTPGAGLCCSAFPFAVAHSFWDFRPFWSSAVVEVV